MTAVYKKGLICALLIAFGMLQGCGKQDMQNTEDVTASADVVYEGEDIVIKSMEGDVVQCSQKDSLLYILTRKENASHLYKAEADGGEAEEIPASFSEDENVTCFYMDEKNNIFCMTSVENADGQMDLVRLNPQGAEETRINLQEKLSLTDESLLNRITTDGQGNIIIADEKTVYSLNLELQPENKISVEENYGIINFARTKSGKIVCGIKEEGSYGGELCILDTEKWEWGDSVSMQEHSVVDEYCLMEGQKYDFYYKDGGGICGYSVEGKSWTTVLEARCSLLAKKDIDGMIGEEQESFLGVLSDSVNGENGFTVQRYSVMKPDENKKTITFAGYNVTNGLRVAARKFNKTHKDCRIEILLYEDEEQTRLKTDIATGKVPDVFSISTLGIPMDKLVRMGALENLTPYLEKDTEISKEDIIPSVLDGMKMDGKLYCVAPRFGIWSAACRADDADGKEGWTFAEMKEALEKKGEGALAFFEPDKEIMLCDCLYGNLNEFINWETGECDFTGKEFKDILKFCNTGILTDEMSDEEYVDLYEENETKMQEGKVLLSVCQTVTTDEIQLACQRFGEDITYIGLPTKDRQGSYFTFNEQYGMYSGSDVKEEAWEFIRVVLSEEYQSNEYYLYGGYFPTRKDCLECNLQAKMATEPYEDAYGNWVEPIETNSWYTESGAARKTGPASQEEIDILLNLIERTQKQAAMDGEAIDIIVEEALAYFNGDKSLDKVCKIIQKRMITYVNEQR